MSRDRSSSGSESGRRRSPATAKGATLFRATGRISRKWVVAIAPLACATLAPAAPAPIPVPPLAEAEAFADAKAFSYATANALALRLFVFPGAGEGLRPAIVFFHGSGWVQGWPTQFAPYARELARAGVTGIVADYRTRTNHNGTPFDGVDDARAAFRWARTHAAELGVDPEKIAGAGGSSGAHLALSAAIFRGPGDPAGSVAPRALVLFSAVVDTTADGYPAGVSLFAGRERELSPAHHLHAGLPPMLVLHGADDAWVPVESVRRFARAVNELGGRCELVVFAGRDHAFYNHPSYRPGVRPEDFPTAVFLTEKFLASLGWIAPPAQIGSEPRSSPTP